MVDNRIAFVLCNYNDSKFLINWANNAFTGSMLPDEIIIVDDCSTDRSVDLIKALQVKYAKLKEIKLVQNQKNLGWCGAFIEGVKAAQSPFVSFLSCDDNILNGYVEKMKQAIQDYPLVDLFMCNAIVEREKVEFRKVYLPFDAFLSPDFLVKVYKNNNPSIINIAGMVIKKEIVLKCWEEGGKDIPTCFDGMCLHYAAFDKGMVLLSDCLVRYRPSFMGWGASGGYKRNKESQAKILKMLDKYPAMKEKVALTKIWSTDTLKKATFGLWLVPKLPKRLRLKIYKKYYEELCSFDSTKMR